MSSLNIQVAEFIVRTLLGILFLFQGYDKLFGVRLRGVITAFEDEANRYHIPRPILIFISYFTSVSEFIGGISLILGLFSHYALYLLGADLLLVTFAFTYMQPMWNMKHVFPRLAMLIFLLLLPDNGHHIGLDYFFFDR